MQKAYLSGVNLLSSQADELSKLVADLPTPVQAPTKVLMVEQADTTIVDSGYSSSSLGYMNRNQRVTMGTNRLSSLTPMDQPVVEAEGGIVSSLVVDEGMRFPSGLTTDIRVLSLHKK